VAVATAREGSGLRCDDSGKSGGLDKGVWALVYSDTWIYREEAGYQSDVDLVGFSVEALDGSIGKIDQATSETSMNYVVVDTGPWIFGQKVLLPAGTITSVDYENESVAVNRTKDEIKNAPPFDEATYQESSYHDELGTYYGPAGVGYRDW
jgi:hypothetical protein